MRNLKQWLNRIPTLNFVLIVFALTFLGPTLNIEQNSPVAIALSVPILLCIIMLAIRFLYYLKAKGSGWHHIFKFFFGYALVSLAAGFFIALDFQFSLKGFLMIPGLALEVGLLIWLFIRYRLKYLGNKHSVKEESSSSYSFENLCDDLSADLEIEFTYDHARYLFMPKNGRYYFKRIVSTDPYEYEVLVESENPLACISSSVLNGKKMTDLWPGIKDIEVY